MKAILIDDEQLALDLLESRLNQLDDIEVMGKYTNPMVGKEAILETGVDIIFLDISLPEINGLELAETILESKPDLTLVFVTAYNKYAVEAFDLNALDYIVKPVKIDRLKRTLSRIKALSTHVDEPIEKDSKLNISVCGYLSIGVGEESLKTLPWRTSKAQELFLYLLQNKEELVLKSSIVDMLWPDFNPERAFSQLYTTIYHIRKTLKQFGDHIHIKNISEGYSLHTNNVMIDLEEWERGILNGSRMTMETIKEYEQTMELYKDDYLQGFDYIWAESERHRLEQLWIKTAFQIADFYRAYGHLEKAIKWYQIIIDQHSDAEEAYLSLMKIYGSMNHHLLVRQQYDRLKDTLENELGVSPDDAITDWYNEYKQRLNISF